MHKIKNHKTIPPLRSIISESDGITEHISLFLEHHIKDLSIMHPSNLQDTPHFLRAIDKINRGPKLPLNAV